MSGRVLRSDYGRVASVSAIFPNHAEGGGWSRSRRSFQTKLRVPPVPRLWGPGRENRTACSRSPHPSLFRDPTDRRAPGHRGTLWVGVGVEVACRTPPESGLSFTCCWKTHSCGSQEIYPRQNADGVNRALDPERSTFYKFAPFTAIGKRPHLPRPTQDPSSTRRRWTELPGFRRSPGRRISRCPGSGCLLR